MKRVVLFACLFAICSTAAFAAPGDHFWAFEGNNTGYSGGMFHDVPGDIKNAYGDPTFKIQTSGAEVTWSHEDLGGGNTAWKFDLQGDPSLGKFFWKDYKTTTTGGAMDPFIGGQKNWTADQGGRFVGATQSIRMRVDDVQLRTTDNR